MFKKGNTSGHTGKGTKGPIKGAKNPQPAPLTSNKPGGANMAQHAGKRMTNC